MNVKLVRIMFSWVNTVLTNAPMDMEQMQQPRLVNHAITYAANVRLEHSAQLATLEHISMKVFVTRHALKVTTLILRLRLATFVLITNIKTNA